MKNAEMTRTSRSRSNTQENVGVRVQGPSAYMPDNSDAEMQCPDHGKACTTMRDCLSIKKLNTQDSSNDYVAALLKRVGLYKHNFVRGMC